MGSVQRFIACLRAVYEALGSGGGVIFRGVCVCNFLCYGVRNNKLSKLYKLEMLCIKPAAVVVKSV
jgi:hypothetical protein